MLDKGDPLEIAEHYRRIMDGTLVDDDDSLSPKRRRRYGTLPGGRATPANPKRFSPLTRIGASLIKAW